MIEHGGSPARIADLELVGVTGERVEVPPSEGLVHLQFRRFAGCPICNLHLQSIAQRHAEIEAAGIREVVFFHSPAAELATYTADLPFATVADPDKRYYRQFGVESSPRALLNPRAWAAGIRGTVLTVLGRFRPPSLHPEGGRLGLPADFLIDTNGTVIAEKRGTHAYDQWSVDELLARARAARPAS
jgi:peroxiredoxin